MNVLPATIQKELEKLGFPNTKVEFTGSNGWYTNINITFGSWGKVLKIHEVVSGCGVMQVGQYSSQKASTKFKEVFKYLLSLQKAHYVTTLCTNSRYSVGLKYKEWHELLQEIGFVQLTEYDNVHPSHNNDKEYDKQCLYFLNTKT